MAKVLVCFIILLTTIFVMISTAIAANRAEPVPLYGSYTRDLDRSKETFNGHPNNANSRPWKQTESFSTVCETSGCIARTPNLYAPAGAPKSIDYHWNNDRWELKANQVFHCNNGTTTQSTLSEFLKPNGDGSFSGERSMQTTGSGCPGEGSGVYRIPFKLTPN